MLTQMKVWVILLLFLSLISCADPGQDQQLGVGVNDRSERNMQFESFQKNEGVTVYGERNVLQSMQERVKRIRGIHDARVLVYDDTVVIAVETGMKRAEVKRRIFDVLKEETRHNIVFVSVNDPEVMQRTAQLQERILRGDWDWQTESSVRLLINDLGTTMKPAKTE